MPKKIFLVLTFLLSISILVSSAAIDTGNTTFAVRLLQTPEPGDEILPEEPVIQSKNSKKNKLIAFLLGSAAGLTLIAMPVCAFYTYARQKETNDRYNNHNKPIAEQLNRQKKKQRRKAEEKRKQEKKDLKLERANKIKLEAKSMMNQYKDSQQTYKNVASSERKQLKDKKVALQEDLRIKLLTAEGIFFEEKTSSGQEELLQQLEQEMTVLKQQIREIDYKQSIFNHVDCEMTQYNANIGPYHPSNKKS